MVQNNQNMEKGTAAVWVAVVILVALISGGGVWWWQSNKAASEKTALQSQITSLQSQLSQQKATTTTPPTPSTTTKDETADWKTYTNDTYGFSFRYPENLSVTSNQLRTKAEEANELSLTGDKKVYFSLHGPLSKTGCDERIGKASSLDLKQYVNNIWEANKNDKNPNIQNKTVGNINNITINNNDGYSFTLTKSYTDICGGYLLLNNETSINFLEKNGDKYMIETSGLIAGQVLSTFQFTK